MNNTEKSSPPPVIPAQAAIQPQSSGRSTLGSRRAATSPIGASLVGTLDSCPRRNPTAVDAQHATPVPPPQRGDHRGANPPPPVIPAKAGIQASASQLCCTWSHGSERRAKRLWSTKPLYLQSALRVALRRTRFRAVQQYKRAVMLDAEKVADSLNVNLQSGTRYPALELLCAQIYRIEESPNRF